MSGRWIAALLVALAAGSAGAQDAVWIGRFDAAAAVPPPPWRVVQLDRGVPPTLYRVRLWDGVTAVEADADRSMALLARPIEFDLRPTPVLCWRWRVDAPLKTADMTRRSGDDFAARVYVAFRIPSEDMDLVTRLKLGVARGTWGDALPDAALNYVWDNRHAQGTRRRNAYTDRAEMIVVRSGAAQADAWVQERRDVLADARQAFGSDRLSATLLAVATDTDNTGERARAGFADLHFVPRDQPCIDAK
ncbi:DUF3047 domain-containing protein [Piscinibacter sp.]|uniref:DUF3047 domain-containing protein n=1 Tax=Piscinibacter sp. TaxID=1903157 RepID=UPI002C17AC82|nr:DUF3047 domain-containing protein [Albitalea sp.]HUG26565.1 DUF3047 domain-containing protein [Albitalea sp.]